MQHTFFDSRAIDRTKMQLLRERALAHSRDVLDLIAADYDRFRSVQAGYVISDERYAKGEFNVLRKFPVIRTGTYELVAPVPQLLIERITSGIYYDLLDAHGEVFTRQFGRQFEIYVGELLVRAYGSDAVVPEPVYRRGQNRGPDWLVRCGSTLILIECTVSGTRYATRTAADLDEMLRYVRVVFKDRIDKFGTKIADLRAGLMGVDVTDVTRIVPVVLTHERLYLEPAIKAFLRETFGADFDLDEYVFMDVGDLEVITAWAPTYDLADVIDAWRVAYREEQESLGTFIANKARGEKLPWQNPYLRETMDTFFSNEIITESELSLHDIQAQQSEA